MKIGVVGLGYVGLPLALLASMKGHTVYGYDINEDKVEKIGKGIAPFKDDFVEKNMTRSEVHATCNIEDLKKCDIFVICVPTPVDKNHEPDLQYVVAATENICNILSGQLIILESTVYPGTTEEIVQPILDTSKKDYLLAYCPERIDPGNDTYFVGNIPRVVGGINSRSTERAVQFYESILDADVVAVSSPKEAEATKIMENTFRDVNIAFINELAMSFDKAGINIIEVIKGASTKPFGFMPHFPGCGVGGHCISVDPYYLIQKAKDYGFDHKFLQIARDINNGMPQFTVDLLMEELKKKGIAPDDAKVCLLGLSYKKNIDDLRNSPSLAIKDLLEKKGVDVVVHDPYFPDRSTALADIDVDAIILCTMHDDFKGIEQTIKTKIVIDGRNAMDKQILKERDIAYRGIGI